MRRVLSLSALVLAAAAAAACAVDAHDAPAPGPEAVATRVLAGRVVDRVTGASVPGARVFVPGVAGVPGAEARADARGAWSLEAPEGALVAVEAPGYLAMRVAPHGDALDLRLYPAETDEAADRALSPRFAAPRRFDRSGDVRPAAHALLDAIERRAAAGDPAPATLAELIPGRAGDPTKPPATIRVWRRKLDGSTASCSGRVDVIPFETYVKGVLPHEWIPSWDPKSLEMGAVAIRTYAWWWVASGGKYTCADVDDTTATQVYEDEFLPKTDAAVDATAGVSIVKGGSLVFAEYSAENGDPTAFGVADPHCAGQSVFGHGRGTCQWGTERWAKNAGKDFAWMAAHYYPGASVHLPGPRWDADFVDESYPSEMTSGDEVVVWIEFTNTGSATWDLDLTRVGTTEPTDRPSPFFKEGNWIAPNRPTGADHSNYGPGAVGRFTFVLRAPEVEAPTTFVETFGLVQEGETWFGSEETLVRWTITVTPRQGENPDPGADPVDPSADDPAAGPEAPGLLGGCRVAPAPRRPRNPLGHLTRMGALMLLASAIWRRGRGFAFVGVMGAALFALGCGAGWDAGEDRAAERRLGGDSALVTVFEDAAAEFGVPADVLATVAFAKTRLRMVEAGDEDHGPYEVGMMALARVAGGASDLHWAAALAGVDLEAAAIDVVANVRAGAAALAHAAQARRLAPVALADWGPVLEAYGGDALAHEVMWRLERGWRGRDVEGRWVVVSARAVGGGYEGLSRASYGLGYPGAIWNPAYSGNYQAASRGAAQINYVVIHTVQGSYSGCISWFKNPSAKVSAHYVVRSSDGQITQMVDDSDVAWHDACFNSESIGIEHEGYVQDPDTWYTEAMYMSSAALTAWLCDQYGIPKDRAHIMGHGETPDCSSHTDPGSGWNWDHYMELVKSGGMPTFDAEAGAESHPLTMISGEEAVVWFEFENRGNSTWGLDDTRLGTQDPEDRESPFYVEGNWLAPHRPTGADHSNYGPGSVGRFTFLIRAPEVDAETTYEETFQLVQEGVTWFGPKVTMVVRVLPRTAPADPIEPGDPTADPAGDPTRGPMTGGCAVADGAAPSGAGGFTVLAACAMLVLGAVPLRLRRRARDRRRRDHDDRV